MFETLYSKIGTLSYNDSISSEFLRQVNLPIFTDDECANSVYSFYVDTTKQICAGDGTGKDTCQGDSGNLNLNSFYNGL